MCSILDKVYNQTFKPTNQTNTTKKEEVVSTILKTLLWQKQLNRVTLFSTSSVTRLFQVHKRAPTNNMNI